MRLLLLIPRIGGGGYSAARSAKTGENDKYVALQFLRNSDIARPGRIAPARDTGTAKIIVYRQKVKRLDGGEAA